MSLDEIFVGREKELNHLQDALQKTIRGKGRVNMLAGEPGIGKTRLAEKLSEYGQNNGVHVLFGRCYEDGGAPSYWPWLQAIGPYIADLEPTQFSAEVGFDASAVASVFPKIENLIPNLEPFRSNFDDPESLRFHLYSSITRFLLNCSRGMPLLIILDDLHWADDGSLKLLGFMARELAESWVMILGTYRDGELRRRHPLSRILSELMRERQFEQYLLQGLTTDHIHGLVQETGPSSRSKKLAETLFAMTEGNPLFVSQIVRHLTREGLLIDEWDLDVLRLPTGLREVIGTHLNRLSDQCNDVLSTAAVLGDEFALEQLVQIEENAAEAIDEALNARIVKMDPRQLREYRFTHSLIRRALIDDLSLTRRAELHARIAETLEQTYGNEADFHAAELAQHYARAHTILGIDKLIHYSLESGKQAMERYAFEESLSHFQVGLDALAGRPMDERQAELLFGKCRSLDMLFRNQEAIICQRKSYDYFKTVGKNTKAIEIASFPMWIGAEGVIDICEDALQFVSNDSLKEAELLAQYGGALAIQKNDDIEGMALLEKALSIAKQTNNIRLEMRILKSWIYADWLYCRFLEFMEKQRRHIELSQQLGDPRAEIIARSSLINILTTEGEIEEAWSHFYLIKEVAERTGNRRDTLVARFSELKLVLFRGKWKRARELLGFIFQYAPAGSGRGLEKAIEIEHWTGNYEQGREYLDQMVEIMLRSDGDTNLESVRAVLYIGRAARFAGETKYFELAKSVSKSILSSTPKSSFEGMTRGGLALIAMAENNMIVAPVAVLINRILLLITNGSSVASYKRPAASLSVSSHSRLLLILFEYESAITSDVPATV